MPGHEDNEQHKIPYQTFLVLFREVMHHPSSFYQELLFDMDTGDTFQYFSSSNESTQRCSLRPDPRASTHLDLPLSITLGDETG